MQKFLCIIPIKKDIRKLLLTMKFTAVIVFLSIDPLFAEKIEVTSEEPSQQRITITGTVYDETGETLPGVSIQVKGTTTGNITDIDGKYQLNVPDANSVLVFNYIGYATHEVTVGTQRVINVTLQESTTQIAEVVVVGYGTQKKASVVGAITATTSEVLQKAGNPTNLAHALTGNLPGVTTIIHTGEPGADDPKIFIRGQGTWNNSSPLILVDGIERKMNDIDVSEVDNVSILKDASATAVYGVKGSEGVILITTKRGKTGKAKLSVDISTNLKVLSRTPEKMESYEALMYRNKAIETELPVYENNWSTYKPMREVNLYKNGPHREELIPGTPYRYKDVFSNTDWAEEMLKPLALSYKTNLNVSGGTDFAKYFGSIAFTHDGDLLRTGLENNQPYKSAYEYNRFNFRTNLDFNLTKTTIFSVNLSGYVGVKSESYYVNQGNLDSYWSAFYNMAPSDYVAQWPDGYWGYTPRIQGRPPVSGINNYGLKKNIRTQVSSDFSLKQKLDFITEGLSVSGSLSYDTRFDTSGGVPDEMNAVKQRYVHPRIIYMAEENAAREAQGLPPLTYDNIYYTEGTDHNTGSGGFDWEPRPVTFYPESFGGLRGTGEDWWGNRIPNPYRRLFYQVKFDYIRTFDGVHDVTATALMNREEYAQGDEFPRYREDWVGRVTYGYDSRYLLEFNGAYNGSEKFASKYRFGFFPSMGIGWSLSNESFIKKYTEKWLDFFKIRYSIGKVGNDSFDAPRWAYQTIWAQMSDRTNFGTPTNGTSPYIQFRESVVGNPELRWETSLKQNLGFELTILKNLVGLTVDVFKDNRTDIFLNASQRNVPAWFGANPVPANLGETVTKGYEIELKLRKRLGDFNPYANINYTHAKDKIIYMEDPAALPYYQKKEGFMIDQTKMTPVEGYLNNWDDIYSATLGGSNNNYRLPGDHRLVDFNGDGIIDSYDNAPYAYPSRPQNTWNATLGLDYKNWSIMVQFYGVFNVTRSVSLSPFAGSGETVYTVTRDYWTPENMDAEYKALRVYNVTSNGYFGRYDASYTRLKTAEIAYTWDSQWIKKSGLSSIRFYLNGNNLIFWSDLPDDREESQGGSAYPTFKRINLGASINF